jgi:hypothetical protein
VFYYVEVLRARRAATIGLVLIALFLIIAVVMRLSVPVTTAQGWKHTVVSSPTAHVTTTKLSDGSVQTVVDDPQQRVHATILEKGNVMDIDATEPSSRAAVDISFGNNDRTGSSVKDGMRHVRVHHSGTVPSFDVGILLLTTLPMGLLMATLLGGVLSKENDGHLELTWTKPVSREAYALAAFAVDAVAILTMQIACVLCGLLATIMFFMPSFSWTPNDGWGVLLAVLAPISWYALLTAASTSIKRGPGLVCGLGWAAAIFVPAMAQILHSVASLNPVARWFYVIFNSISYLDPIRFVSFTWRYGVGLTSKSGVDLSTAAAILAALIIGYLALSLAQWRRVEA